MKLSFSDLKPGDYARVIGFHLGDRGYRQQLLAMGLTRGAVFEVIRCAPLGDPVQIRVRQAFVCLRKAEAGLLQIVKEPGT